MAEPIKFIETKEKLTIEISPDIKPIVRFSLIFEGVLMISAAFFFIFLMFRIVKDVPIALFFLIGLFYLYFIVGKNYLKSVFHKEIIEISKRDFTIIDKYLMSLNSKTFPISEISNLALVNRPEYTKNSVDNYTYDSTGLATTEREIQYVIEDGTIQIFYDGAIRQFGKNIASWDAEEIIKRIEMFVGHDLKLDSKMKRLLDELDNVNKIEDSQ